MVQPSDPKTINWKLLYFNPTLVVNSPFGLVMVENFLPYPQTTLLQKEDNLPSTKDH